MVWFVSQWQWWRRTDKSSGVVWRCWQMALFKRAVVNCSRYEERLNWRHGWRTLCCLLAEKAGGGQMIRVGVSVCSHSTGPIGGLADRWTKICTWALLYLKMYLLVLSLYLLVSSESKNAFFRGQNRKTLPLINISKAMWDKRCLNVPPNVITCLSQCYQGTS